jgi:hypothetical protein
VNLEGVREDMCGVWEKLRAFEQASSVPCLSGPDDV